MSGGGPPVVAPPLSEADKGAMSASYPPISATATRACGAARREREEQHRIPKDFKAASAFQREEANSVYVACKARDLPPKLAATGWARHLPEIQASIGRMAASDPALTDMRLPELPSTCPIKQAKGFQSDVPRFGPSETLAVPICYWRPMCIPGGGSTCGRCSTDWTWCSASVIASCKTP